MTSARPGRRIEAVLDDAASEAPASIALVAGESRIDYRALRHHARRIGARLVALGVEPGDRVAVLLDKTPACVGALYGAWYAGAVVVPVNESLKARQVRHILANSEARVVVTDHRKQRALAPGDLGGAITLIAAAHGAGDGDGDGQAVSATPASGLAGGSEPAAILYTSGSTGLPKGILITHDNLLAGCRIVCTYLGLHAGDRVQSVLPFSFDYGLNQLLDTVLVRATLVLQRSTLPADICRTLERERITVLAGVPPLWAQLLGPVSPLPGMDLPDLRLITNSGGAFPIELVRRFRSTFPHADVYLMYGLSEAFRSTYLPPTEVDVRPGSMGRAIPECEILVLDPDGRPCPPGVPGELVHRGPTVAAGYWRDPQATARVFRPDPEWPERTVVHSGDLVVADTDGFLSFVGRRDELIKSQGYRISPTEVEAIVFESGLVHEVVAAGEPDPAAGAVVVVHIVPIAPGAFDKEALLAHCQREMPRYMVPRTVYVHEAFARTASGKVDRKDVTSAGGSPAPDGGQA